MPNPRGLARLARAIPGIVIIALAAVSPLGAAPSGDPGAPLPSSPEDAPAIARVSRATADDRAAGPPGPFTVLPGGRRIVIRVPASEGLLVLEGSHPVQHLRLPHGAAVLDLAARGDLLVAGAANPRGRITISLAVFDLAGGTLLIHVESANPFLRMDPDSSRGWRVVAGDSRAGIFHPPSAASYPLWARGTGIIPSSEQIGRALAGIGLERGARWVPEPDGSVGLRKRGHTVPLVKPGHGEFVDGLADDVVLMRPESRPGVIELVAYRDGAAIGSWSLPARDPDVSPERAGFTGRVVQAREGRVYWAHVGRDAVEIRAFRPKLPPRDGGS